MENIRKSLAILEALSAADPTNPRARRDLAIGYEKLGDILAAGGDAADALENFRRSLAIEEPVAAADPTNARLRRGLAFSYNKVGDMMTATGDKAGALDSYRKALAIREGLAAADPTSVEARRDLAVSCANLGEVYARLASGAVPAGQRTEYWRAARSWYQRSSDIYLDMRARGTLRGSDARLPDAIADEIAKCDKELNH